MSRKSYDYKLSAVNYYLVEDKTQEEVCKIFKCSRRSLMRWVERYKKDGNVDIYYRKPVAYKVKKEYVDFLLQELKKNKTITIEDLLYLLKNKYPDVDLNKSHINRIIKDNNITLKLTRFRHRNQKIKDLVNKDNEILYSVPYQHFTNAIENWFRVLKSKLQKKEGLTYNQLQTNIGNVLRDIPLITFQNIFKGVYERPEKYNPKNKTRKIKKNYL